MSVDNNIDDPCSVQHVEEGDELLQIVAQIVDSIGVEAVARYRRFSHIVYKYQEQAQLLDPLLEDLVKPLAGLLYQFALDDERTDITIINDTSRLLWLLATVRGYKVVLRFFPNEVANFEPVVGLLSRLKEMEQVDKSSGCSGCVWEAQYVLLLWLSTLVLIPFNLSLVDSSLTTTAAAAAQSAATAAAANELALQQAQQEAGGAPNGYPPIVGAILLLCRGFLSSAGSVREMAAVVVGRLVTRPDMRGALEEWVGWGCQALLWQGDGSSDDPLGAFTVLGAALTFCTIFKLGKRDALLGTAGHVLPAAVQLLGSPAAASNALARKLAMKLVQRIGLVLLRPRLAAWRYRKGRSALLGAAARAQQEEQEQRAAVAESGSLDEEADADGDLVHIEQIEGVIEALLTGLGDRDTVVRWCSAKGVGRVTGRLPKDLGDEVVGSVLGAFFTPGASDTAWHGGCLAVAELARRGLLLPERLPEVTPLVTKALEYDVRRGPCSVGTHVRDAAAYVCWAFARAYTPEALGEAALQLAPALITLACYDREVNCRRAAAAAYQECVGRLGNFPHGIDILTAADYFTVSARSTAYLSVAPYVASFPEYFEPLALHLLLAKLRHWEKALRETAAMALAALVPHRPAYFLQTAIPLLLPLVTDNGLEVRHGAVAAIAELLPALRSHGVALGRELEKAVAEVLPAVERSKATHGKGGEVMRSAICRLIETTSVIGLPLSPDQQTCLYSHIVDNLRHASPDIQRAAAGALAAYARQYLAIFSADSVADTLDLTTRQFLTELREAGGNPPTRRGAALALGALPRQAERWLLDPLRKEVLSGLASASRLDGVAQQLPDAETRVNAVRALGQVTLTMFCLPESPAGTAGTAAEASKMQQDGTSSGDSCSGTGHTRGAAVGGTCRTDGTAMGALAAAEVKEICKMAVEPLLRCLEDYGMDNRGDVGSWVREEAMKQLHHMLPPLLQSQLSINLEELQQPISEHLQQQQQEQRALPHSLISAAQSVLLGLLRQSVERISRVREAAAAALHAVLPAATAAGVPWAADIASVLCPLPLEGFITGEALQAVAGLLRHPPLQRVLLEGLGFSIGGLDNQLSTAASEALAAGVQQLAGEVGGFYNDVHGDEKGKEVQLMRLGEAFLRLWEDVQGSTVDRVAGCSACARRARMATPLLATADVLLSRTPLRDMLQSHATATEPAAVAAAALSTGGLPSSQAISPNCTDLAAGAGAVAVTPLGERLLGCVRVEIRGCSDIPRLHLAACVLCQLAELPQPTKGAALASAIGLLANRYPKVRRYAAEQLYTALLTFDLDVWDDSTASPPSDVDSALELLSVTTWDGPLEVAKQARSQLYQCFGLPEPKLARRGGRRTAAAPEACQAGNQADENSSYQALIDRNGRGF